VPAEGPGPVAEPATDADIARRAGADLGAEVPEVADWLAGLDGPIVLGNYVYADGGANVRVCAAADALTVRLLAALDDLALAFLATPTDVFTVPADAVAQSVQAYADRPLAVKLAGRPLRTLSGGRLLRRAYVPGADPGISDSLVAQQGPNYALAKRMQRWRASIAREAGTTVSLNVAPPTRTKSVVKNKTLAAAYAGAHQFGVGVFEPDTCRVLMAALLVHDLHAGSPLPPGAQAACGGSRGRRAVRSGWPPCSASAPRETDKIRQNISQGGLRCRTGRAGCARSTRTGSRTWSIAPGPAITCGNGLRS
jgi:hypothetical protein